MVMHHRVEVDCLELHNHINGRDAIMIEQGCRIEDLAPVTRSQSV